MNDTGNEPSFTSGWTPTDEQLATNPSLMPCLGCGQWLYHDAEACNCWTYPDAARRGVSDDESLMMMRRIVRLTELRAARAEE